MFERFTHRARRVVLAAQSFAREHNAETVRSEHLLAALVTDPDGMAVAVLARFDVTRQDVEAEVANVRGSEPPPSDAEALATLGIDLDEVRRQVEDAFGPGALDRTRAALGRGAGVGHIPFDRSAKKVLELALREAIRLGHTFIGTEHLLLGMLHAQTGAACPVLNALGVTQDAARHAVEDLAKRRRAG